MSDITYTITRGDEVFELVVEYRVAPRIPARGPSWDSPGEPEEGGEIVEIHIEHDGEPFTPTDAEQDAIEQHIYETHDYSDDGFDDPADWSDS